MNILGRISAINTLAVCYIYSAEVSAKDHGTFLSFHICYILPADITTPGPFQVFPTVVRNIGLGSSSFWARVCFFFAQNRLDRAWSFSGRSHDRAIYSRSQGLWGPGAYFAKYTHTVFKWFNLSCPLPLSWCTNHRSHWQSLGWSPCWPRCSSPSCRRLQTLHFQTQSRSWWQR